MKKLKNRAKSTRDDFPTTGRHIHFVHIRDFVREGADFTEKESAHFDVCRGCRLKVIDVFRNLAPQVETASTQGSGEMIQMREYR